MKTTFLTLFTLLAIAFVISRLAKYVLRKTLTDYDNKADELDWEQYSFTPPNTDTKNETTETTETKDKEVVVEQVEEQKEKCETSRLVLNVINDDSSRKRKNTIKKETKIEESENDVNDIQNLTNYNKNVYRSKNGRFKSVKSI
jgi:hypothetical protein